MPKPPPPPDFYTGPPVLPEDLWFREAFIAELTRHLSSSHVILSAPRRTGKTSVMDYLVDYPPPDWAPISVLVQDISHPADFILLLLDLFHEKHPRPFRKIFQGAKTSIGKALAKVGEIDAQGFKITFRQQEPDWRANWKKDGDEFFTQVRKSGFHLLLLVDEFPDMLINMHKNDPALVKPFLAWFRGHRLQPHPKKDCLRWLLCGSVNLSSTVDAMDCLDLINDPHDIPLPPLTDAQVVEFVAKMLGGRGVEFSKAVPARVAKDLGRPIPVFLQMVTQDLYRIWKLSQKPLTTRDVETAFSDLVVTSGARDKLQHYYSRIEKYYLPPKRAAAYALLALLSIQPSATRKARLFQEFERILVEAGDRSSVAPRQQLFNQLLRDLENDFYVVEIEPGSYDFASGLIKLWWRRYYA